MRHLVARLLVECPQAQAAPLGGPRDVGQLSVDIHHQIATPPEVPGTATSTYFPAPAPRRDPGTPVTIGARSGIHLMMSFANDRARWSDAQLLAGVAARD